MKREDFFVLRHFQSAESLPRESVLLDRNLHDHVILRVVIGSRAYGLDTEASDTDRRGVYLPPADLHWSLFGVPEQLEEHATQETYWEIEKFLTLALKANPNVLECLYSPMVEFATELAQELIDMREAFLSKLIFQTYSGYVASQFAKMQADLRNRGQVKWKHAMHLLRLLIAGATALRERHIPVRVESLRDRLLSIKRGEVSFQETEAWRLRLQQELEEAYASTMLPDRPDYTRANAYLLRARRFATGLR